MSLKHCNLFTAVTWLSLAVYLPACGVDEGEITIGTDATTAIVDQVLCAIPQFEATGGPSAGEYYACDGYVAGQFSYTKCLTGACSSAENVPIDGDTGDGEIAFPPDPTDGGGVDVEACCDPDIEGAGAPGSLEGTEACVSDCAHAACSEAIARFEAMLADPTTWAGCNILTPPFDADCIERVQNSLEHYKTFIHDHFGDCVASVVNSDPGSVLNMGNPGCTENAVKTGCLAGGVLDMTCNAVTIDFGSNAGTCEGALHQPPTLISQACEIDDGGGEVRRSSGPPLTATFRGGSAVTRYFACGAALCPFVLDGLELSISSVSDAGVTLSNISAELVVAAYGQSDGTDVEFDTGAIRVMVSGNKTDSTGTVPFVALGATISPATGTHDSNLLSLDSLQFEAGGYTFVAYVDPSACTNL